MRKLAYFAIGCLPVLVSQATELDRLDHVSVFKWIVLIASSCAGGVISVLAKTDDK
jgi:hypothetical protein